MGAHTFSNRAEIGEESMSTWIKENHRLIIGIGVALAMYIGLFLGYKYSVETWFASNKSPWELRGLVGDSYGALNTFLSGLALLGVIFAILLQRYQVALQSEELKLQRQELADTRAELAGQKLALESQNRTLRDANTQEVLSRIVMEYRTTEMLWAVKSVRDLARNHGDSFVDAYVEQYKKDRDRIDLLPEVEQLDAWRSTLHDRRRKVTHFYMLLAGMYESGLLEPQLLFTYWTPEDLDILPKLIVPIETGGLPKVLGSPQDSPSIRRLMRLYEDSVYWSQKMSHAPPAAMHVEQWRGAIALLQRAILHTRAHRSHPAGQSPDRAAEDKLCHAWADAANAFYLLDGILAERLQRIAERWTNPQTWSTASDPSERTELGVLSEHVARLLRDGPRVSTVASNAQKDIQV